ELPEKLKELKSVNKKTVINVSTDLQHTEKEVSADYKNVLTSLKPGDFSQPSAHKSRTDKTIVFRIFNLKENISGEFIPFNEVENQLKDKLLDEAITKETDSYLSKLKQHFDVQDSHMKEMLDNNFQPFMLK